jgi:hypothetical protein
MMPSSGYVIVGIGKERFTRLGAFHARVAPSGLEVVFMAICRGLFDSSLGDWQYDSAASRGYPSSKMKQYLSADAFVVLYEMGR